MKGLNIKGLCKQIKESKWSIIWSLKDGKHMITNRQWMIVLDALPKDVSITLFSIFAEMPAEGQSLQNNRFIREHSHQVALDVEKIFEEAKGGSEAKDTGFIYSIGESNTKVFKSSNAFAYVNEKFLAAVDADSYRGRVLLSGRMSPLYYEDINYIALPYRVSNDPEKEIIELFTK